MNVYERIIRIIKLFQEVSPITLRDIANATGCPIHVIREDVKNILKHDFGELKISRYSLYMADIEDKLNDDTDIYDMDTDDMREMLLSADGKELLIEDDEELVCSGFDDEFCTVTLNSFERELVKNCIAGNFQEENIIIKKLNAEDRASYQNIRKLNEAIQSNCKVEIVYKLPKGEKRDNEELKKKEFFPVALVKFVDKNIYYVVKIKEGRLITYRVDRIQSIKVLKERMVYSEEELQLLDKFDFMWSTESEEESFDVKLRVTKEAGVYQRMKEELQYRKFGHWEEAEDYYYYFDKVIGKFSFVQWIRKYGKSVMVMEPVSVAKEIYEAALLKREMYNR